MYNFQVEDFYTYHVGCFYVLVHNADYNQSPKEIMAERTKGLDTREHSSKYKQISAKEKARLKVKIRNRTITKDEYKTLRWNEKMATKRRNGVNKFWKQERVRLQNGQNGTQTGHLNKRLIFLKVNVQSIVEKLYKGTILIAYPNILT